MKLPLALGAPLLCVVAIHPAFGQSLGNAGTIEGSVVDPAGAAVAKATVTIHNAVTGYKQVTATGSDGTFRFSNIPPNSYHVAVTAPGFAVFAQDVSIRNAVPIQFKAALAVASAQSSVTVEGAGDLIEVDPSSHIDADRTLIMKLPSVDPAGGLSQAITYSTGGVVADGNGLFHPLGDHAQSTFVIDGQPISDQQSKVFSTQLPTSAIQSMEVVTGTPDAEFGDKSSLVANITTRSGLGAPRLFGNVDATYGSFGSPGGSAGLRLGNAQVGNLLALGGGGTRRLLGLPGI